MFLSRSISAMPTRAVIFDLDGTLIDTLAPIARAMNEALDSFGLPTHPESAYRRFIGDGVVALVERAAGVGLGPRRDALIESFRSRAVGLQYDPALVFPGVLELLERLRSDRVPHALLSNKPHGDTVSVVARLFPGHAFVRVYGHRPGYPAKPDPASALEIANALEIPPARCVFVGDSETDMKTASAAGMTAVGVSWGMHAPTRLRANGAAEVLSRPAELLDALPYG